MPDREKVIKGLECCECPTEKGFVCECSDCPYYCGSTIKCRVMLKIDALALLKEQETANIYKCPNCGTWVSAENVVRCKDCQFMYISECDPNKGMWCCARHHILSTVQPDFFCADGEPKEGR